MWLRLTASLGVDEDVGFERQPTVLSVASAGGAVHVRVMRGVASR
jgi:hypothetical protein